jgi:hypothetical protein
MLLRTSFFALDWTLRFTRTTVIVDGQPRELPWGQHFLPLEPGRYEVRVSYRYLHLARAGQASVLVEVAEDQVIPVSYRAPRSVLAAFLPGRLATGDALAAMTRNFLVQAGSGGRGG